MTRIENKFDEIKTNGNSALVCYITAGDPSLKVSRDIVIQLEKAGADIIELGIPFSDPMADGPTIQLASERALLSGTNLTGVLGTVKEIREQSDIPIILFGYYNPFFKYGLERFSIDAKEAGADGVLIVDLPPDEAPEFKIHLDKHDLNTIFLLAPNSTDERISLVAQEANGFIYLVSLTGVTGARPDQDYSLKELTDRIRKESGLPVGIGFGVSSPDQARKISSYSDAVIVGSALVRIIENNIGNEKNLLKEIYEFTKELSDACHGTAN